MTHHDPDTLLAIIRFQTDIVRTGADLGMVMQRVAHHAQTLTRADGAVVELLEGEDMSCRAATGITEAQLGLRIPQATSLSGLCMREGHSLVCTDAETDPRVDRAACRKVGLRSMVVVPLRHDGVPVGVVSVLSARVDAFTDVDASTLTLLSEMIAAAMHQATEFAADTLFQRATRDPLTDLANRAVFHDRLGQALERARREGTRLGVLVLDMNNFKNLNDAFGHRTGDAALVEVARRIRGELRGADTGARTGGDEFAILLNPVRDRAGTDTMVERLRERLTRLFVYDGQEVPLSVSVGVATVPEDGDTLDALIEAADAAMYREKRR